MIAAMEKAIERPKFLFGARNVAAYMGISERKAFYLLENGLVPAKKVGANWVASPDAIDRHLLGEAAA